MNATRLAAAGMIGVFGSTRARLLAMARDRHRAVAPEPGLDLQFLSGFAQYLENRARRFRIGYAAIGLLALLCAAAEAPVLSVLLLLVAALIAFAGLKGDRGLRERLQVRTFDLERLRRECWAEPPGSERDLLAGPEQNLVVYSGFSPFGFAGVGIGSWSVAIDVERGREEFGSRVQPTPFTAEEVYARLCSALTAATNADVKIQDCAFASGVGIDPALFPQRDRLQKPSTRIDPARLLELVERRDPKLRHYKWARVEHPPSEIVLSYFLRCGVERKNLFVEVDRVFLGPVEEGLHQADELPPWELVDSIAALQGALVLGPVLAGWNLVLAPFRVLRGIGTALGLEERALRKAIRRNPRFDFGAAPTLRQSISSTSYRHYYERVDKELGQKAIDREIFNTLVDFLHERGVDVSELREGQASILNNGIIVQQGDLNSSSVAVGENSRAAVIRRKVVSGVQKVTRKPASAPAGG